MARTAHPIHLSDAEHRSLTTILRRGTTTARTHTRARVLEHLNRGEHPSTIAHVLSISVATVFNIKRRYLADGLDAALTDKPRTGRPIVLDGVARAKITALACSAAPEGHARWTLRLLADTAVELGFVEQVSHNAVKEILKKTTSNRTGKSNGVLARSPASIWRGWKRFCTSTPCPTPHNAPSSVWMNYPCSC